jgi:tetratricopeptide (TPR) repeat protein
MYSFSEQAQHCIWNHDTPKAIEMLSSSKDTIYRSARHFASINIIKGNVTTRREDREAALKDIEHAFAILEANSANDEAILNTLQQVIKLNEQSAANPIKAFTSIQYAERISLTDLTDKQQFNNIKMDMELIRAELYLEKGILDFHTSSYLKGAYNLRKSWKTYESLYEIVNKTKHVDRSNHQFVHPELVQGVKYGIGTFYYILSILPSTITKVLSFLGFKADRDEGIALLCQVANESTLWGPAATFMLALNYLFIPRAFQRKEKSLNDFKPMMSIVEERFPNGSLFLMMSSHYWRKSGDLERANESLEKAIKSAKESFDATPTVYMFELAQNYIILEKFDKAKEILESLVSQPEFDTRGFAALELASLYIICGMKDKSDEILKNLDTYICKTSRFDKYTQDKLKLINKIQSLPNNSHELVVTLHVAHYEMLYLRRDLANLSVEQTKPLLESFRKDVGNYEESAKLLLPDTYASCLVIEACMLNQLQDVSNHDIIKQKFKKVISLEKEIKYEKQWVAFANYEMAELLYFETEGKHTDKILDEVSKYIEASLQFKGYALEDILRARIKLAKKQVEDERKNLKI